MSGELIGSIAAGIVLGQLAWRVLCFLGNVALAWLEGGSR